MTVLTFLIALLDATSSTARPVIPRGRVGPDDPPYILRRSTGSEKRQEGGFDIYDPSLLVSRQVNDPTIPQPAGTPTPATPTLKKAVTFSPDNGRQSGFIMVPTPAPGNARQTLFFDFEMPVAAPATLSTNTTNTTTSTQDPKKEEKDCEEKDKNKDKNMGGGKNENADQNEGEANNKQNDKNDGGNDGGEGNVDDVGAQDAGEDEAKKVAEQDQKQKTADPPADGGKSEAKDATKGAEGNNSNNEDKSNDDAGGGTKVIFKPTSADDDGKDQRKPNNEIIISTGQKDGDAGGDAKSANDQGKKEQWPPKVDPGKDATPPQTKSDPDGKQKPAEPKEQAPVETPPPSKGLSEADLAKGAAGGGDEKKLTGQGDDKGGKPADPQAAGNSSITTNSTQSGRKFDLEPVKTDEVINAHKGDVVAYVTDGDKKDNKPDQSTTKTGDDGQQQQQRKRSTNDGESVWYPRAIRQRRNLREARAALSEEMMQRSEGIPYPKNPKLGMC